MGIRMSEKQEGSPRAPISESYQKDGRKRRARASGGCYGDLVRFQRFQRWPRSLYIPFYRFPRERRVEEGEREREIRSTPAITPASDLIISRSAAEGSSSTI